MRKYFVSVYRPNGKKIYESFIMGEFNAVQAAGFAMRTIPINFFLGDLDLRIEVEYVGEKDVSDYRSADNTDDSACNNFSYWSGDGI